MLEISTNKATTEFRRTRITGLEIILKRPKTEITSQNYKLLQLLDLLSEINKLSELDTFQTSAAVLAYIKAANIKFAMLEPYLALYPDNIYKNLYSYGVLQNAVA